MGHHSKYRRPARSGTQHKIREVRLKSDNSPSESELSDAYHETDWSEQDTDKYGRTYEQASGRSIGTCPGCGRYGNLGDMHVRNGEECGEFG